MTTEDAALHTFSYAGESIPEACARELSRLRAERDALKAALRARSITEWNGALRYKACALCGGQWGNDGHERHGPGCLAAPDAEKL